MNEQLLARAGAFARFLSDRPSSVIVSDLANKLLSQSPGILNDYLRFETFKTLLEWHYARASSDQRLRICSEFGFQCVEQPEQLLERVSKSLNIPALAAVRVLGKCMRVTPEYTFDVFPVSERMYIPSNTKPIEEIPESLTVGGAQYTLRRTDWQHDFAGFVEQAVCQYQNGQNQFFYLVAARYEVEGRYGMTRLSIGHAPAFAYLLGRTDIDRGRGATVILPLSLDIALELRSLTADSRVLRASPDFIVSGVFGNTAAMKHTEFSPLLHHRVILIPEFYREGLLAVDDAVALCRKAGAAEVSIYPWPLFLTEPAHATTAWGEEFQRHGIRLDMEESPFLLLKKIEQDAVTPSDFHHILEEYGVLATEKNTHDASHSNAFTVKHLKELKQGNVDEQQFLPDLGRMFSVGQISLLWGPSNSGKSLVAQTIALALASGSSAFSIKNYSEPRRVLLIDGELTEEELRSRVEQLVSVHADFVEENLLFFSLRGAAVENCNIISDNFAKNICETVRDKGIHVVIIDNLITLASSATYGKDDDLFALIRNIERNGAAVIIVHHSTKRGDAFKGSSTLASKSQNIIQVDGRDTLMTDEELEPELGEALASDGAVVRLRWQKCKIAPSLEGSLRLFKLPLGGSWEAVEEPQKSELSVPLCEAAENALSDLSPDECCVMALFDASEFITRKDVETCLNCGEDKAGTILNSLKRRGSIISIGGGRSTAYRKA